jgi:hypothetical protein
MRTFWADAGFVRSWKLNLRLTTRAYDNHAAPDSNIVHLYVLLRAVRARSVADSDD